MSKCLVRFPIATGAGGDLDVRNGAVFSITPAEAYDNGTYYVTADSKSYHFTNPPAQIEHDQGQVYRYHFPGSSEPTTYRLVPNVAGPVDFQDLEIVDYVPATPGGILGDELVTGLLENPASDFRAAAEEVFAASPAGTVSDNAVKALLDSPGSLTASTVAAKIDTGVAGKQDKSTLNTDVAAKVAGAGATRDAVDARVRDAAVVLDQRNLTRLERDGLSLARRYSGQAVIDYADSAETTIDLSTLTGSDNANVSVAGNKLYGTSTNPPIAYWPFSVADGQKAHAAGSFVYRSGATGTNAFYAGVETSDVGTAPATNTPSGFGVGHQNGTIAGFRGSAQSGIGDAPGTTSFSMVDGKTYEWAITLDELWISLTIRPADNAHAPYGYRASRTALAAAGKSIKRIFMYVQDNRGSTGGSYANPFASVKSQQPVRTKTVAGVPVEGVHPQDIIMKGGSSLSADNWRIQLPANYDPRRPAPVVIYLHQSKISNPQDRPWSDARDKSVQEALAGAGYIFASANDSGDRWGNQASLDNYVALWDYIRKHYATSSVVLWACSMGGMSALNLLAQRKITNVAAMIGVGPVCDLDVLYANATYTADIKAAYGIASDGSDYDAKTAGFNPIDRAGWEFRGTPMRFYTGPTDTIVPNATNADALVAKVAPYAPEAVNVVASGGHLDASQYQPSDVLTFLAKYV